MDEFFKKLSRIVTERLGGLHIVPPASSFLSINIKEVNDATKDSFEISEEHWEKEKIRNKDEDIQFDKTKFQTCINNEIVEEGELE